MNGEHLSKLTLEISKLIESSHFICSSIEALSNFALDNIAQMIELGSSFYTNIVIQVDMLGDHNIKRIYIDKNNPRVIQTLPCTNDYISGTTESLYKCVEWAINSYPAENYALFIWNHGSGPIDPAIWGKASRDRDLIYNERTALVEINRKKSKGTAFNDTYQTYLTNPEQKITLDRISKNLLGGQKLALIIHDACLQASIEVASESKNAAKIMVASEEIELASGFNYKTALTKVTQEPLTPEAFAEQIVLAYQKEYKNRFADFTLSSIDLSKLEELENNVSDVATALIMLLGTPEG